MASESKKTTNRSAGAKKPAAKKSGGSSTAKKTSAARSAAAKKAAAKKQKKNAVTNDLVFILALVAALFLMLSLFGAIGMLGTKIANFEFGAFGSLAFLFPVWFFIAVLAAKRKMGEYPMHTLGKLLLSFLLFTVICGLCELIGSKGNLKESLSVYYHMGRQTRLSGGFFGGFWCRMLVGHIGKAGSYIVLFALLLGGLVLFMGRALLAPIGRKGGEVVEAIKDENHRFRDAAADRRLQAEIRLEERELKKAEEREQRRKAEEEEKKAVLAKIAAEQAEKKKNEREKNEVYLNEVRLKKESILKQEALLKAQAEAKAEADRKEAERNKAAGSGWEQMTIGEAEVLTEKPLDELIREMESHKDGTVREIRTLSELDAMERGEAVTLPTGAAKPSENAAPAKPAEKKPAQKKELFTDDVIMSGRDKMNPSDYVATGRIAQGYRGQVPAVSPAKVTDPEAGENAADSLAARAVSSLKTPAKPAEPRIKYSQPQTEESREVFPGAETVEADRPAVYSRKEEKPAAAAVLKPEPETEPAEEYADPREQLRKIEQTGKDSVATGKDKTPTTNEEIESIWASAKDRSGSGSTTFSPAKPAERTATFPAPAAAAKPASAAEGLPESRAPKKEYQLPSVNLLKKGKNVGGTKESELKETARILEQTLADFGVIATVTDISCGPAVTRYELKPEQGVRVSRIAALADDIKLSLAATDIRIEAPIPGKSAVGIEVPNSVNQTVYFRTIIESEEFARMSSKIGFAVGQDIGGQVIVSDLAKMPHLLIAGATGSGKSVCVNGIIMSILYRAKPDEVQLLLIDPKMVELTDYNGIPHLRIPVVTDPKLAADALNGAVKEMTGRYKKFADMNVRDIKSYNAKIRENPEAYPGLEPLPQMVIIVDEFADLMMTAASDVEQAICRLAQLARAAGIHLVLATQRPSVNVITGLIKANIQSRIALAVTSGTDSRIILDMTGAEKLLGHGDMLFYPTGYPKPVRVQGCFVSDEEIAAVTEFWKKQNSGFTEEDARKQNRSWMEDPIEREHPVEDERDELFIKAAEYIIDNDKASIGNLQRVFRIGFNRAARLMDQLADVGIVSKDDGTKARQIMMDRSQLDDWERENGYV